MVGVSGGRRDRSDEGDEAVSCLRSRPSARCEGKQEVGPMVLSIDREKGTSPRIDEAEEKE